MTDNNASGGDPAEEATLFPKTAGERLRDAREAQGMSLAEIAERTRVPIRHLEGIENSDFSALPSPTYAVGFAKAYARVVGLDEALIGREVRGQRTATAPMAQYQPYEASDPKRLPPRGLAIGAALVALIAVAVFASVYSSTLFQGGGSASAPVVADTGPTAAAPTPVAAAPVIPANGQVVLTANDVVWLRVYTPDKTLYEAQMNPGDRYELPADAVKPMINVGRPDKLTVTVNGSAVAPLGTGERAIKDVEVSAAALLARGAVAAPDAAPAPAPPPAGSSTRPVPERRVQRTSDRRTQTRRSANGPGGGSDETRRANAAAAAALPGAAPTPAP